MRPRDFSRVRHFPGTGTPGTKLADRLEPVFERIPAPLFAAGLALLAGAAARSVVSHAIVLGAFLAGDWIAIALLPRFRRSFGPIKLQVAQLAVLRLLLALVPWPWTVLAQLAGTVLMIDGFWIEPHRLIVTRQQLRSARLPRGRTLRLLHLGDLHVERLTAREEKVATLARTLAPDLIVFTGDFLSTSHRYDGESWEACRWVLSRLPAPLGVFAVTGSPAVDREDNVPPLLEGLPVRWLRDERITLRVPGGAIELIGLSCTHRPFVDGPRLIQVLGPDRSRIDEAPFTILLYHTPDLAPEAAASGIDLMLSGHTHGGQVRLPFYGALVTASLYGKTFEMGRRRVRDMVLYVTRGLGLEGTIAPRVRFLCPPEVVLWELNGE